MKALNRLPVKNSAENQSSGAFTAGDLTRRNRSSPVQRQQAAFSLVEVTIAIGIVAFAFLAILGMLPVGLQTFSRSMDATVEAQIAQRLHGLVQQAPFSEIHTLPLDHYFDMEGLPSTSAEFVYHARIILPAPFSALPTSSSGGPGNPGIQVDTLKRITVEISKNLLVQDRKAAQQNGLRTHAFLVADVGL